MKFFLGAILGFILLSEARGQAHEFPLQNIPLDNMSAFRSAAANWRVAGDVSADLNKDETLATQAGSGVLVNLPDAKNHDNLVFNMEHGDLDLELEVMMARHSNSGIYLQGRYEVQLLDSWGKKKPYFGDMAGVYQRWNDQKKGQEGFEGTAPRVNVAKAPGLWQHLRIEFQAPRFDAAGKKTANARLIKVTLNGVVVHENIELTGPTRGPAFPGEAAKGPILIQGDHGPVAFRNIRYRSYSAQAPALSRLTYTNARYEPGQVLDYTKLKTESSGEVDQLTWEVAPGDNEFALRYKGVLRVRQAGKYNLTLSSNGTGMVKIKNDTLIPPDWWTRTRATDLPAGETPIEIYYAKYDSWLQPALGLFIEGADFRPTPLHTTGSLTLGTPVAPIFLEPRGEPELLRSFLDIPAGKTRQRITHALSAGFPTDIHYSYNLNNGALMQVWKGGFLETTPMWHDRGDGHADPRGSVLFLGNTALFSRSGADTLSADAAYRFGGYSLDENGTPTFQYRAYGLEVSDKISPQNEGKFFLREIKLDGAIEPGLMLKIARGRKITSLSADTWSVDDKRYYIQANGKNKPQIKDLGDGVQELWIPAANQVQYAIVW